MGLAGTLKWTNPTSAGGLSNGRRLGGMARRSFPERCPHYVLVRRPFHHLSCVRDTSGRFRTTWRNPRDLVRQSLLPLLHHRGILLRADGAIPSMRIPTLKMHRSQRSRAELFSPVLPNRDSDMAQRQDGAAGTGASLVAAVTFFASFALLAALENAHQPSDPLLAADNARVAKVALCVLLALGSSVLSVILGLRPLLQADFRPLIWLSAIIAGWALFLAYYDFASLA